VLVEDNDLTVEDRGVAPVSAACNAAAMSGKW
jgi:hypothetical protein